jgi:hypothetical protein
MNSNPISVVIFGRNPQLLETRQWVLQSRGYRVFAISQISALRSVQSLSPALLILCHSLSSREREAATAFATSRWPAIKHLVLAADSSRNPSGILGQLLHTMGGPTNLLSMVGELVGHGGSSSHSHTY